MSKRVSIFIVLVIFIMPLIPTIHNINGTERVTLSWQYSEKPAAKKILLIPLDNRPPCMQFVIDLAKIKNYSIITPPADLLGNYKTPADSTALRVWLSNNIKNADAAIISTDMLIHGGLWASRLAHGNENDINTVLALLEKLHNTYPNVPLYVFNIIPRLIIGDNEENTKYQKSMVEYSVLKDKVNLFENPRDFEKLMSLTAKLPFSIIEKYNQLYQINNRLNQALIDMTANGIISNLVIGQDDSKPFGIPNNNKILAERYLAAKPDLENRVHITRGTDEVALTLLGTYTSHDIETAPIKTYVAFSDGIKDLIMPYMPHSVQKTAAEKLAITNTVQTNQLDNADYILYIFVRTKEMNSAYSHKAANEVINLLNSGHKVALVDLSYDFKYNQTLLPFLLSSNANLSNLIAYAGWNTTSNSIGTAVTQAQIYLTSGKNTQTALANLKFTLERMVDDLFYQKKIQPFINSYLASNSIDPYNLGIHQEKTAMLAKRRLEFEMKYFIHSPFIKSPFTISTPEGTNTYKITDLKLSCYYPWSRTFEIAVDVHPEIVRIKY